MKINLIHMLKFVAVGLGIYWACLAAAEQRSWVTFVTPIKCKTFEAELISVCYKTRKDDEPAICQSQTLRFQRPAEKSVVLFKAVHPRTKGEHLMIGRHAFDWFCSRDAKGKQELLTLKVGNWFNARDEDIIMFANTGVRLKENAVDKIAGTASWHAASSSPEKNATAYGTVNEPSFE